MPFEFFAPLRLCVRKSSQENKKSRDIHINEGPAGPCAETMKRCDFVSSFDHSIIRHSFVNSNFVIRHLTPSGSSEYLRPGVCVSSRRAFTLLELMLAMMIVAIIVPVLYNVMHASFTAKAKSEAAIEPARTAELSMDMLRTDLTDALPPTGVIANAFIGTNGKDERGREADDLIFYSTADAPQDAPGTNGMVNQEIKQIELTVMTTNTGDHVLVRKITRDMLGQLQGQTTANPDVEVICRGVGGFQLRYFDGYHWGETWDTTQTQFNYELPAAVQVILTLDRPNGYTRNSDGSKSFVYTRNIPLSCSYAPFDTTINTGFSEQQ
jgi:prepilin-type N-terminal cleavage/methylation domain-containing protein